jgi:DNA-binding SARP family transcriptional activator
MKPLSPHSASPDTSAQMTTLSVNASLIYDDADASFLSASLIQLAAKGCCLILTEDDNFLANTKQQTRLDFSAAGLVESPIHFSAVSQRIENIAAKLEKDSCIVVDMRWGLRTVSASANFDRWGGVCDQLVADLGVSMISVYGRNLMIEDQLLAALRGHSHFLAPSGTYSNPYWLPPEYVSGATLTQQVTFMLERLVPDYAGLISSEEDGDTSATGADPHWITTPRRIRPRTGSDEIWKIRCFGRLRIYLTDGSQIRWNLPGSAPKKSKALFAFLLQRGERGASAEQLAEMMWADTPDEAIKRSRLHHTVAMLRKSLGGRQYLVRSGDYYSIVPPTGTWIDISSFEQLCNRSKVLARSARDDEALTLLDAADRLYSGELFEDLLPEYVENDIENWIIPKRTWLREMMLKVLRDKAVILRKKKRLREALECCQRALDMDPACEIAHAEAMRIFHAQGRMETVTRQLRQFHAAMDVIDAESMCFEPDSVYAELLKTV